MPAAFSSFSGISGMQVADRSCISKPLTLWLAASHTPECGHFRLVLGQRVAQLRGSGAPLSTPGGLSLEEVSPKIIQDHVSGWWDVAGPRASLFLQFMLKNNLFNGVNGSFWVGHVPLYLARWEAPGCDSPFLQHHCSRERSLCKCFQVCFLL